MAPTMIKAEAYANGDDCFVAWTTPFLRGCWGFEVKRTLTRDGKRSTTVLENRTGFEGDDNPPNSKRPSTEWPFQRYTWTDHGVQEGDRVRYEITPVMRVPGRLEPDRSSVGRTATTTVTARGSDGSSAYFNRGILLSQFMARQLGDGFTKADLLKLKRRLREDDDDLRAFLMGPLGARLRELLADAKANRWHVYAALYELDDPMLVRGLKALGKKAHVVLANGSTKTRGEDGNADAVAELGERVDLTRRMLWSEGLGHNKFVVFSRGARDPFMVWTGSTNWASTGLCTQVNNGVLIEDAQVARIYLDQWKRLKEDHRAGRGGAAMHFGADLMASNDAAKQCSDGTCAWDVWFTRTSEAQDLAALREVIAQAEHAILFLMFEPGTEGLLKAIQDRLDEPDLYVQGVVNTLKAPAQRRVKDVDVQLVAGRAVRPFSLRVIQPEGVGQDLASWATEVTRRDFIMGQGGVVGHAIIHSKVVVVDPFTNPVVITGSHNFSKSASGKNDENFVIIRGDRGLAERYAVNIMGVYQHYRWRAYLQECERRGVSPWQGLKRSDRWQARDAARRLELAFWT